VSGDRLAAIIATGAMTNIPSHLSAAVFRALQKIRGEEPAWAISHMKRKHLGGSGIPSEVPGEIARVDHIQITINGVPRHIMCIIDEATLLWALYLLRRKLNMGKAIQLYESGTVRPAGWRLKAIRADAESTLSIQFLEQLNSEIETPFNVLVPLSSAVWDEHCRQRGVAINKTAAEEHEKMAERNIQALYSSAIYATLSQDNLTKEYMPYALLDAAEKSNGTIGRTGLITRYEHFWQKAPDFHTKASYV
jgi:hypothetical protein